MGGPGALARRLGARRGRPPEAEGGRAAREARPDLRQPRSALDRGLVRALDVRLRRAHLGAAIAGAADRAPALEADREAHDTVVGSQLGGRPRPGTHAPPPGPHPARARGAGPPRLRAGLHDVPAARLRALPQPVLPGVLSVRRDV